MPAELTLPEILRWLQSSVGVNWVIGFLWSYLVEWLPFIKSRFTNLSKAGKRIVIALFSLLVPLLAFVLKILLGYEYFTIDNIWAVFVAWGMAFFGSHVAHLAGPSHPDRLGNKPIA